MKRGSLYAYPGGRKWGGVGVRTGLLRTKSCAPGKPGPVHPRSRSWRVRGSSLAPPPVLRLAPPCRPAPAVRPFLVPGSRRRPGSLYLARHPGLSPGSQLPARAGAPAAPPAGCGATLADRYGRGQRAGRRGRRRGLPERGGGDRARARPAPRLPGRVVPLPPGDPRPRRPAGRRRTLHFPEGAAAPARGWGETLAAWWAPGPHCLNSRPREAAGEGLGAGTRLVARLGCACPRVRIHPSILAFDIY